MPPKYAGRRTVRLNVETESRGGTSGSSAHADSIEHHRDDERGSRAAAPAKRFRSPLFWKAEVSTPVFKGPLGEPVGKVTEGTVLRELSRYEDPFGGWWFSTRSTDGALVWLSCYDPESHPMEGPEQLQWRRVFDSRATPESERTVEKDSKAQFTFHHPFRSTAGEELCISQQTLVDDCLGTPEEPSDVSLIDFYWNHLDQQESIQNGSWNLRYQSALENLLFRSDKEENLQKKTMELDAFMREFEASVEAYTTVVVEELAKPIHTRHLHVHPSFRHVFYHDGIVFKLIFDSPSGDFGGDRNAVKSAREKFLAAKVAAMESTKHFLYHPLHAMCSFKGHTVAAFAIPPFTSDNCIFAPLAEQHSRIRTAPLMNVNLEHVMELLSSLGDALNLKKHEVKRSTNDGKVWLTALPAGMELYGGRDHRIYLVTGSSLAPPLPPLQVPNNLSVTTRWRSDVEGSPLHRAVAPDGVTFIPKSTLLRRLRPEVQLRLPEAINPDTFVEGCYEYKDAKQLLAASEYIRGVGISAAADTIGFHRPVDQIRLPSQTCVLCQRQMEEEMRLLVCHNPQKCCQICSHCYCMRMAEAYNNGVGHQHAGEEAMTRVRFTDAVKCGCADRAGHGLLPQPSITDIMHGQGLNMSLLPFVFSRLPFSSTFAVEHFLKVEMCARVAAEVLRTKLATAVGEEEVQECVSRFFAGLLSSGGPEAEVLWAKEIGPAFNKKYPGLGSPLFLSYLSTELLAERAEETCGVRLTEKSWESLRLSGKETMGECFIEVAALVPKSKTFLVPRLTIATTSHLSEKLNAWIERLLLFWIGLSSKGSPDDDQQPFYLSPRDR